jgi:SAM-dependent methyltransferase
MQEGRSNYDYKEYPKTCAPDDFWGQIRRTVNGKPVSDEQIAMIVEAVRNGLRLQPDDCLLDLACGNGALSRYFFEACRQLYGVDHSDYLIQVAKKNFERLPDYEFACGDAADYVRSEPNPERFTKALCYGSFSFFSPQGAQAVLDGLRRRFGAVRVLYIGNLPDRERAHRFYRPGRPYEQELADHTSQIGTWRNRTEFAAMARKTGWKVHFHQMGAAYYAAHYRYDAVLEPLDM